MIARRQIFEIGGDDNDIARMLRRREIATLLPGIYLTHTGRPTRLEREWAAVDGDLVAPGELAVGVQVHGQALAEIEELHEHLDVRPVSGDVRGCGYVQLRACQRDA